MLSALQHERRAAAPSSPWMPRIVRTAAAARPTIIDPNAPLGSAATIMVSSSPSPPPVTQLPGVAPSPPFFDSSTSAAIGVVGSTPSPSSANSGSSLSTVATSATAGIILVPPPQPSRLPLSGLANSNDNVSNHTSLYGALNLSPAAPPFVPATAGPAASQQQQPSRGLPTVAPQQQFGSMFSDTAVVRAAEPVQPPATVSSVIRPAVSTTASSSVAASSQATISDSVRSLFQQNDFSLGPQQLLAARGDASAVPASAVGALPSSATASMSTAFTLDSAAWPSLSVYVIRFELVFCWF